MTTVVTREHTLQNLPALFLLVLSLNFLLLQQEFFLQLSWRDMLEWSWKNPSSVQNRVHPVSCLSYFVIMIGMFRCVQIEVRCWNSKTKFVACSRRQATKPLPMFKRTEMKKANQRSNTHDLNTIPYNSLCASNCCFSVNDRRHKELIQKLNTILGWSHVKLSVSDASRSTIQLSPNSHFR